MERLPILFIISLIIVIIIVVDVHNYCDLSYTLVVLHDIILNLILICLYLNTPSIILNDNCAYHDILSLLALIIILLIIIVVTLKLIPILLLLPVNVNVNAIQTINNVNVHFMTYHLRH